MKLKFYNYKHIKELMNIDIVVVGGGILGAAHAYAALKKGLSVTLLEKDSQPGEATVRNFGQIVPSGMPRGEWFEYGRNTLNIYTEIQSQYDIGLRNNGSIYIASCDDEMAVNIELFNYYQSIGYPCQLLSKKEVLAKYPGVLDSYPVGALFFPLEHSAEPEILIHRFHEFLSQKFPKYQFITGKTVVDIQEENHACTVITASKERFTARNVIVCSGRDFKALFPEEFEESELVVSKLHMFSTLPLPQVQLSGNILTGLSIRRYESFSCCDSYHALDASKVDPVLKENGIHILFKQRRDGSIIIGDSHEYAPYDKADQLGFYINNRINDLMLKEAKKIIQLPSWDIDLYWVGFYAQCKNDNIFRKKIGSNTHIITGIGGKGMSTSLGYAAANIDALIA